MLEGSVSKAWSVIQARTSPFQRVPSERRAAGDVYRSLQVQGLLLQGAQLESYPSGRQARLARFEVWIQHGSLKAHKKST